MSEVRKHPTLTFKAFVTIASVEDVIKDGAWWTGVQGLGTEIIARGVSFFDKGETSFTRDELDGLHCSPR